MTEARIQQEIFFWFNNEYCRTNLKQPNLIFSVPNETSSYMELKKKKATGLVPGVSDLIVVLPNIVLFVEVKTPSGKQSVNQLKFEKKVTGLGFRYELVRSLKDFQKLILSLQK